MSSAPNGCAAASPAAAVPVGSVTSPTIVSGGRLRKRYVRLADLAAVRAAREARQRERRELSEAWQQWRQLVAVAREVRS